MSESLLQRAKERRMAPDGEEQICTRVPRNGELVNKYPWEKMQIGDYFIAPIIGSKNSMLTVFRQTAARLDWEVAIADVVRDGQKCIRVTKILEGIAKIKAVARSRGAYAPSSDVDARKRYLLRRRMGSGVPTDEAAPIAPVSILPSLPEAPIAAINPAQDFQYDRQKMLDEARLKAAKEDAFRNAGLDEDDEDFMGVFKNG